MSGKEKHISEVLPAGFFDNPVLDEKVRKVKKRKINYKKDLLLQAQ